MYGVFQFDDQGRQTMEARCLLKTGAESRDVAKRFFETEETGGEVASVIAVGGASTIGAGTACYAEYDAWGDWTGSIICGNELCSPTLMSMRSTSAGQPSLEDIVMAWSCSGGGSVVLFSSGFAGYIPPGGGETTTPVVPPCGVGGGGGGEPDDSIWDEFRWAVNLCSDSIPTNCVPLVVNGGIDTTCYRALETHEKARLDSVLQHMIMPLDSIADSAARAVCQQAAQKASQMLASDSIFAGRFDSPGDHVAMWFASDGLIHIDPALLDSARYNNAEGVSHWKGDLLAFMLHEALHPLYYPVTHPSTGVPPYTMPPFSFTNEYFTTATRSPCVRW